MGPLGAESRASRQTTPAIAASFAGGERYERAYSAEASTSPSIVSIPNQEIGRLLKAFESLGLAETSTFVFTADHGETMLEHEAFFAHGDHVGEAIVRVPLMIRAPDRTGRVDPRTLSLVDILPALLRQASVDVPEGLDGYVLGERPADAFALVEASAITIEVQQRAVIQGSRQHFASVRPDRMVAATWWTDVSHDPGEVERRPWRLPMPRAACCWTGSPTIPTPGECHPEGAWG